MSGNCDGCDHDRTGWPRGQWDDEPDRVEFVAHGLTCLLHRNHFGAWCGYVAVPSGHPAHGIGYDDVHELNPELHVHGGLTYSGVCEGAICHIPKPGEPDDVWWFGFDCAHEFDIVPRMLVPLSGLDESLHSPLWEVGSYKDAYYVHGQTTELAKQLAEMVS